MVKVFIPLVLTHSVRKLENPEKTHHAFTAESWWTICMYIINIRKQYSNVWSQFWEALALMAVPPKAYICYPEWVGIGKIRYPCVLLLIIVYYPTRWVITGKENEPLTNEFANFTRSCFCYFFILCDADITSCLPFFRFQKKIWQRQARKDLLESAQWEKVWFFFC